MKAMADMPGDAGLENRIRCADTIPEHRFAKVFGARKTISVIIPYYRKKDTLPRVLEGLRNQRLDTLSEEDVEIVVVDDGSEDGIVALLPESVMYVIQRRIGFGLSRARNTGAKLANGSILVFLDPDLIVNPDYLEGIVTAFARYGERTVHTGYVSSYYYEGSPDPRVQFGVWECPDRPTRRFFQIAGGNMAISRSLFFESPGFDEDLIYGELEDILYGYHIGLLPETGVVFNSAMSTAHIPHPIAPFHAQGHRTVELIRRKWPDFHRSYIVQGLR